MVTDLVPRTKLRPGTRCFAAQMLQSQLSLAGFEKRNPRGGVKEEVWVRKGSRPNSSIVVYTTIEDGLLREAGKDAIRVIAFLHKQCVFRSRIRRAGHCEAIANRVIGHARAAWRKTTCVTVP